MSNFQELVKNLYTSKNRELTEEKLQYIEKNYKDKEQDFVKNFYATIGEELTEDKFNYINDKYLKKKESTSSQSSVGSSVSQKSNQPAPQANTSQNKTVAPQSNASKYAVDPSEIPSADEIKQSQAKRKEQDAKQASTSPLVEGMKQFSQEATPIQDQTNEKLIQSRKNVSDRYYLLVNEDKPQEKKEKAFDISIPSESTNQSTYTQQLQKQQLEVAVKENVQRQEAVQSATSVAELKEKLPTNKPNPMAISTLEIIKDRPDLTSNIKLEDYVDIIEKENEGNSIRPQAKESKFELSKEYDKEIATVESYIGWAKDNKKKQLEVMESEYGMPFYQIENNIRAYSNQTQVAKATIDKLGSQLDEIRTRVEAGETSEELILEANKLTEQYNQEVEKAKPLFDKMNSLISDPNYQAYQNINNGLEGAVNEYLSLENKEIYNPLFDYKQSEQAKADKAYADGDLSIYLNEITNVATGWAGKFIKGTTGILTTIGGTLIPESGDVLQEVDKWVDYQIDSVLETSPTPNQLKLGIFTSSAQVGDYKVYVNNGGKVKTITDLAGRSVSNDVYRAVEEEYNNNKNQIGVKDEFSSANALNTTATVVVDMVGAMANAKRLATVGISNPNVALITAYTTTMFDDFKDEAIQSGLSHADAQKYALGMSTAMASLETIVSPLETKIIGGGFKSFKGKLTREIVQSINTGKIPISTYVKEFAKPIFKETASELRQEIFYEPLVQGLGNILTNQITGGKLDESVAMSKEELKETIIPVVASTLLIGSGQAVRESSFTKGRMLKSALDNPTKFYEIMESPEQIGITEDKAKIMVSNFQKMEKAWGNIKTSVPGESKQEVVLGLYADKLALENESSSAITESQKQVIKDKIIAIDLRIDKLIAGGDVKQDVEEEIKQQEEEVTKQETEVEEVSPADTKVEPTKEEVDKEDRRIKNNRLFDLVRQHDRLPMNSKGSEKKGRPLMKQIQELVKDLGYTIGHGGKNLNIINDKGKPIAKQRGKTDNIEVSVEETEHAKQEVKNNGWLFEWGGDMFDMRLDLGGVITWSEIRKGYADIKAGKDSVPARRLIKAINEQKEKGGYDMVIGSGSMTARDFISQKELQEANFEANKEAITQEVLEKEAKEFDEYIESLSEKERRELLDNIKEFDYHETEKNNEGATSESTDREESKTDDANKETEKQPINASKKENSGVGGDVTFQGKRGQADSITFDGKTIKQGEEIELNDVNISQDDSMPDLRSGKYKVRMLSVDANGKTATLTLTDGNEVITTTVKDLRKSEQSLKETTKIQTNPSPTDNKIKQPKNEGELAEVIAEVFGLKDKKGNPNKQAKSSAKLIAKSINGLIKAGVFKSEKEFWDAFPTMTTDKPEGISQDQMDKAKGYISIARNAIHAFIGSDVSTPLHEVSHWWLANIEASAKNGNIKAKRITEALDRFAKSPQGKAYWDNEYGGKFNPNNEVFRQELFARGFENYLRDGKAPDNTLKSLFDEVSNWFKEIYQSLTDLGIEINGEMSNVYSYIMTGDDVHINTKPTETEAELKDIIDNIASEYDYLDKLPELFQSKGGATESNVELINGFYSPLEKIINNAKQEKMPVKQWIEKFARGEEAKWTGLTDWLGQQQGSVSKTDIQQFLKDNRIEIVEVVKSGKSFWDMEDYENFPKEVTDIFDKHEDDNEAIANDLNKLGYSVQMTPDFDIESFSKEDSPTKFSAYQLEGEKENYKEVLVTMPVAKSKQEYVVEQDYRTPNTFYAVNQKTGVKLKFGSYELAKSQAERLSKESQPDFDKQFKSSHFDEPNILVHLRMNTRTDTEGNKVLFLEEVQSDWGQQGKKEGFEIKEEDRWNFEPIKRNGETVAWKIELKSDKNIGGIGNTKEDAIKDANKRYGTEINTLEKQQKGTPSAPFVTDTNAWTKLGLKVALKEAVKQGADKIAWTTGEQQNNRYDLSKSVDGLEYQPQRDGKYDVFAHKDDNNIFYEKGIDLKRIEDVFGKDIADKISKNEGTKATYDPNKFYKRLEGDGLKVGGKGMKGFYGSPTEGSLGIVGNVAKSLFKQEPKTIKIEIAKKDEYTLGEANYVGGIGVYDGNGDMVSEFDTKAEANKYIIERSGGTQHSIDITPELKVQVEEQGQSLFQEIETKKNQALRAIANYATKALDKNPDMSYKEFESRLISHPITEQLVKDLTPKAVKAIFRDKKGNTDADERGVNPKNTRKNSYTDRAVDQASANISAEMNELKRTRDVTNLSAQKEVADKIFDSMLNSPNPTATFEGFNKLIGITTSSNPNDIAIDSMIMQKIRHYYADTLQDGKMAALWTERIQNVGGGGGVFNAALANDGSPESLANKVREGFKKEQDEALAKKQLNGKTGQEIIDDVKEAIKTTPEEAKSVSQKGVKTKDAKDKAKNKQTTQRRKNVVVVGEKSTADQKKAKQDFKAKAKEYLNSLKDKGLLQNAKVDGYKGILSEIIDDIIAMGAKSKEQALNTFINEMEKGGMGEADAISTFNEVWSADNDTEMQDVVAQDLANSIVAKTKSDTTVGKKETDPIKILARALLAQVADVIPKETRKGIRDKKPLVKAYEKLAEVISNKGIANDAWVKALESIKETVNANSDLSGAEKAEIIANVEDLVSNFLNQPLPKTVLRQAVKDGIKDLGIEIDKAIENGLTDEIGTGKSLAERIVEQTGLDAISAQEIERAVVEDWNNMLGARKETLAAIQLAKAEKSLDDNAIKEAEKQQKALDKLQGLRDKEARKKELDKLSATDKQKKLLEDNNEEIQNTETEISDLESSIKSLESDMRNAIALNNKDDIKRLSEELGKKRKDLSKKQNKLDDLIGKQDEILEGIQQSIRDLVIPREKKPIKQKSTLDKIMEAMSQGVLNDDVLTNAFAEKFGFGYLTNGQIQRLKELKEEMTNVAGIERKNKAKRNLVNYLATLDRNTSRKVFSFLGDTNISQMLSGIRTWTMNIPIGSLVTGVYSNFGKIASNIGKYKEYRKLYKELGLDKTGAFLDILKNGYNQLDEVDDIYGKMNEKGSIAQYIKDNGAGGIELDRFVKNKAAQKIIKGYLNLQSKFQIFGYFANAFDAIMSYNVGEYDMFLDTWERNGLNIDGSIRTEAEILQAVKEEMGYDGDVKEEVEAELEETRLKWDAEGFDYKQEDLNRERRWLMMQKREIIPVKEALQKTKSGFLMGTPTGAAGFIYEQLNRVDYVDKESKPLEYILNTLVFTYKMTLMPFLRIATKITNIAFNSTPILGSVSTMFFEFKPVSTRDDKTGKITEAWGFVPKTAKERRNAIAYQTAITGTVLGMLSQMFKYDDDDDEDKLVLDPNRLFDFTLKGGGELNSDTPSISIGVNKGNGEFMYFPIDYIIPLIIPTSILGFYKERSYYRDFKGQTEDVFRGSSIPAKIGYASRDYIEATTSGLSEVSFMRNLRIIKQMSQGDWDGLVRSVSSPFKMALPAINSNLGRDVGNIAYDIADIPQADLTPYQQLLGGITFTDPLYDSKRLTQFGKEKERKTILKDIISQFGGEKESETALTLIKTHPNAYVQKSITYTASSKLGKKLEDRGYFVTTNAKIKQKLEAIAAEEWGKILDEKFKEDYESSTKDMSIQDVEKLFEESRTEARERVESTSSTIDMKTGESLDIEMFLYKRDRELFYELFPKYKGRTFETN